MNLKKIFFKSTDFINNNYLNFVLLTILFISAQTILSPILSQFLSDEIEIGPINFIKDIYLSKEILIIYLLIFFPLLFLFFLSKNFKFDIIKNNFSYLNIFRASLIIFVAVVFYKIFKFFNYDNLGLFYLIKPHYLYIFLFSSVILMYLQSNNKIYFFISIILFMQFVFLSNGNRANLITMLFIYVYFNSKFLNKHFLVNLFTIILFVIFVLPINYSLKCRNINGECFKNIFYDMSNFVNIYEDQYDRCLLKQNDHCLINTIGKLYSDATIARVVQLHNINKVVFSENVEFKREFQSKTNIFKETITINPLAKKLFNLSESVKLTGNEIGRMLNIITPKNYTTGISIPTYIDLNEKFGFFSVIIFSFFVGIFFVILNNSQNHNLIFFLSPFFFIKTIHSMENFFISFLSNLINLFFYFSIFYLIIFLTKKLYKNE